MNHVRPPPGPFWAAGSLHATMPRPRALKHPANIILGLVLLVCAASVAACGKSSPSSSTSASVATGSTTAGAGVSGGSSTGSTSASKGTGKAGSTQPGRTNRRRVKKANTGTGTSSTPRRHVKASALRLCLEKNGIKPHSSGSKGATRVQLQAALARCDHALLPQQSSRRSSILRRQLLARPAYRRALARFTSCMRKHGVPGFPEADTSGKGPLYPSGTVKSSPQVRAAQRACIGQLRLR